MPDYAIRNLPETVIPSRQKYVDLLTTLADALRDTKDYRDAVTDEEIEAAKARAAKSCGELALRLLPFNSDPTSNPTAMLQLKSAFNEVVRNDEEANDPFRVLDYEYLVSLEPEAVPIIVLRRGIIHHSLIVQPLTTEDTAFSTILSTNRNAIFQLGNVVPQE